VALDADPESLAHTRDRPLEPRIVERDQPAALLAHEMMVMLAAGDDLLESGLPVAHLDPLDQPVLNQQLERPVDRGPSGGAARRTQCILDLDRAERARLGGEQLDHAVTRAAVLQTGTAQDGLYVIAPLHHCHKRSVAPHNRE
jgi:hypothetical protein